MFRKLILTNTSLILIIFLGLAVLLININKPFIGHQDFTNAFDGVIARNYLQHGVLDLKFGQSMSLSGNEETRNSFYTHYPPLLTLMIAASFYIFGIKEWAERLIPIIFTLIGLLNFYLIINRFFNKKTAFFGSFFYIFNPMFIYFGNMAVPDPVILGLSMLAVNLYLLWLDNFKSKYFNLLVFVLFIGGLIGWSIDVLAPIFIVHSIIVKKFKLKLLLIGGVSFLTLFLQLLHTYILTGDFLGGSIKQALMMRLADPNLNFGGQQFTLFTYLKSEFSLLKAYFSKTMIVLVLVYVILNFKNKKNYILGIFLANGLFFPVIFSRYVFVHDFLNIYLLPFFASAAGLGLVFITNKIKNKQLGFLIAAIILVIFAFERIEFTKALLKSDMNLPGIRMATIINELKPEKKQVVIVSPRFKSFYGVFTNFYSKYPYSIISEKGLKKDLIKYDYIITIDEDIQDQDFYSKLKQSYKFDKKGDITIFYVK